MMARLVLLFILIFAVTFFVMWVATRADRVALAKVFAKALATSLVVVGILTIVYVFDVLT